MKTKLLLILLAVVIPKVCVADEYVHEESYDAQDGSVSSFTVYSDSTGLHRRYDNPSLREYDRHTHHHHEPRIPRDSDYPTTRDIERAKEIQAIERYNRQARLQEERQQAENDYQVRRNTLSSINEASFAARNVAQAVKQINDMMKGGSGGNWYGW